MSQVHFYLMFFMVFVPTAVTAIEIMKVRKHLELHAHGCEHHQHPKAA